MFGDFLKHQKGSGLKMPKGCQIVAIIYVLSIWHCSAETRTKAHHYMSEDDLRKIFQVEHHSDVPKYEVVQIHSVRHNKRSSPDDVIHRVRLDTHGKRLQLELSQNRHLLKRDQPLELWFAEGSQSGNTSINYLPGPEDTEHIGDVYQDERNQAAMLLYRDKTDDALLMDGTIGDDLVVKPLPSKIRSQISEGSIDVIAEDDQFTEASNVDFVDEYLSEVETTRHTNETDDYAFLDEDDNEDVDVKVPHPNSLKSLRRSRREIKSEFHVVYKRKDTNTDHSSDYNYMEMDNFPMKRNSPKSDGEEILSRQKRQAPYIIFPEILCIIDYDGYRLHGKDNIAIKRYVISFWNGIDLRYKLLKHPSVKISIAGIIISRGRDATPYLERNRVGNDALDSASALTDMGKYLFLERRLPVYDIAVAITKLDMCRRKSRYGECNRGTAGFAYVGGACVVNKRLEKVNSVAIVEDTGGFSGIIVAAHELGHLLGAVHDGSPPPSYLGGPGAGKCRWEDGFIMSDLRHTSKGFRWSHCTINQFKHFLNGETATCMYNSPHETESLPRVLPGKLLTLDAQCRKDRGTSACFKDGRVCAQLFCFDAASGYCVSYRPAAEGSRCGDGQMCLNGKCVLEHENSVDYDGNGFLRKLGEVDEDDYDSSDSPAEPSNTRSLSPKIAKDDSRKWWNQVTTSDKKSTEPIPAPATSTSTTTSRTTTTTFTSTITTNINDASTTRAPWWRRIQRRPSLGTFSVPQSTTTTTSSPSQNESTSTTAPFTTVPAPNSTLTNTLSTTLTTTLSTTTTATTSSTTTTFTTLASSTSTTFSFTTSTESTTETSSTTTTPISTSPSTTPTPSPSSSPPSRTTSRSRSRSQLLSISDRRSDPSSSEDVQLTGPNGSCEDRITNIAGSMTCKTFLRSFAYQYCRHKYIRTNCCASHKVYCLKGEVTNRNGRSAANQQSQRRRRQQARSQTQPEQLDLPILLDEIPS